MKRSISTLLAFFLLLSVTTTVFGQKETISESFSNVEDLELDIAVGDITIVKSNSGKVELEGTYNKDRVELRIMFKDNELRVVEKMKHRNEKSNGGMISTYKLALPESLDIKLNAGTGDVRISEISGELESNAGTGDIHLTRFRGEADINCGTGDIKVENAEGELDLNSGTGNVAIFRSSGEINANSGTGNVSLEKVSGELNANSGSGDVIATQIAPTDDANINSGNGMAKLTLDGPVKNDISVNSGNGTALLEMKGQSFNGTLVMVCDKDHGSIDAPFAFDKEEVDNRNLVKYKYFGDANIEIKVSTGNGKAKVVE